MILSIKVNNFMVYSNEVELSLKADMRIKKFASNVYKKDNFKILKSACIYGANNSGKTCLLSAISVIRNIMLGVPATINYNLFSNSKNCSFGISFIESERVFNYEFEYDFEMINGYRKAFHYECLKELFVDKYGNYSEKEIFIRDVYRDIYRFIDDEELSKMLGSVSSDNILIYTINSVKFPIVETYKKIFRSFAEKIDILDMNNIPLEKTISVLKNNESIKEKTIELIKLADLDISDYTYVKNSSNTATNTYSYKDMPKDPKELILRTSALIEDMTRLTSVHKGVAVPSMVFDSTGTKKIVAVASYVVDALQNGKMLIIDELDSSLHFKLTRAIVALFNNDLNKDAQLIFSAHDITLLDCKKLFRKDQIWFAAKDSKNEYLYPLSDFNAQEDKIRSESDLFEKYNSGVLGAIPEPDLISVLINISETGGAQ